MNQSEQNRYYRPQTAHQMRGFKHSSRNFNFVYQDPTRDMSSGNVQRIQVTGSESESEHGTYNRFQIS